MNCNSTEAQCTRLDDPRPLITFSTRNKGPPCVKCPKICHHKQENLDLAKKPMLDFVKDQRFNGIKLYMENQAHLRKVHDLAKFKMERWLNQNRQDLEERRDRLFTMLQDEDDCYRKEIEGQFEMQRANQLDEMRKRVTTLRANREAAERKFAEQKMELCFQSQCEQMRTLLSKRLTKEIVGDWATQIQMKNRLECESQAEERLWAEISNRDIEEKERREEAEKEVRREKIQRELKDLKKQVELKQMKKAEEYKIKLRELAIIEEDLRAIREEKENEIREKEARFIRNRAHVEDMINTRNYYRDRRTKREEVAAREFLKNAVRELYLEEEDREKKKREMMRAIQLYREYTRKRECLEIEKEDVVQRIVDQVIEEQYKKSMDFRFKEAQQRHELHCSVLAGRAQQVEDKKRQKEIEESVRQQELEKLKEDWRMYIQELEQEKLNKEAVRRQYVCDLNGQVKYQRTIREREESERKRQEDLCALEERLFQNRMRTTVRGAKLAMSNPYRHCFVGKPVRQCFRQV